MVAKLNKLVHRPRAAFYILSRQALSGGHHLVKPACYCWRQFRPVLSMMLAYLELANSLVSIQ